jgi:hypothetical protein
VILLLLTIMVMCHSFVAHGIALAAKPGGSCTIIAELKSKVRMGAGEKVMLTCIVHDCSICT